MYDLCVVGAGLVGSAAARHASLQADTAVCLIGPKEPQERSLQSEREIFGAHYDEGRITRCSDPDPIWATLAQRSIDRYRDLEKVSGKTFYTQVGCLMVGHARKEFMKNTKDTVSKQNIPHKYLKTKSLQQYFPYLNISHDDEAVFEKEKAGYISPRKLIDAQLAVATDNGCDVIDDVVNDVKRTYVNNQSYMIVCTEGGRIIKTRKVLLATGAFTTFRNVLGTDVQPDVTLCPLTVAKVEVSEDDAKTFKDMPSILYYGYGAPDWWTDFPRNSNNLIGIYALPPIKYPNGKYYIKLGNFADSVPNRLKTVEEVKNWYCTTGSTKLVQNIAHLIVSITKGIEAKSYHGDYCVVQETPTHRPYIDLVHSQLGIAIGGNGYAAKSSDEIGRIAAMLVLNGSWDSELPAEEFRLRLKTDSIIQSKL